MKIVIFAAAALVATTFSALADDGIVLDVDVDVSDWHGVVGEFLNIPYSDGTNGTRGKVIADVASSGTGRPSTFTPDKGVFTYTITFPHSGE